MSITSPVFLSLYLPLVPLGLLLLQKMAPENLLLRKLWLLLFSATFIVLSDLQTWWILAVLMLLACLLPRFGKKGDMLLIVGSVLLLVGMKLFHTSSWPVGLSFVTLQVIALAVETMRSQKPATPLDTLTYLSFYPKLSAGPLDRPGCFVQTLNGLHITVEDLERGLTRFVLGLSKKLLIADKLSPVLEACYGGQHPFLSVGALVLAPLVIYFDFSGYADMACGMAQMLGMSLQENFDHPFRADSMRNFWKRWHITLSRFLMEMIYFPLGGSRKGERRTILNLLIVFLISGLWHGFTGCYLAFGLCHAALVIVEHKGWLRPAAWKPWLWRCYVLLGIALPFVIFMAPSLSVVGQCFAGFVKWSQPLSECHQALLLLTPDRLIMLAVAMLSAPLVKLWQRISTQDFPRRAVIMALLVICYCYALSSGYSLPLYASF